MEVNFLDIHSLLINKNISICNKTPIKVKNILYYLRNTPKFIKFLGIVCIIIYVYEVLVLSKKDKLLKFIKNNPTNVKFEDLKKVLENIGYEAKNRGGSHYVFTKKDSDSLCIPYKKPVKVIYVKQVIKILEEEENER